MSIIKRFVKILILCVLIYPFVTAVIVFLWMCFSDQPVTYEQMVKKYEKYQTELTEVANFMAELEYERVSIAEYYKTYEEITVHDGGAKTIAYYNEEITKTFKVLFGNKCKCQKIHKSDIYIDFYFAHRGDHYQGIIYSITGKKPEIGEIIHGFPFTKIESLGYENWYFYELY